LQRVPQNALQERRSGGGSVSSAFVFALGANTKARSKRSFADQKPIDRLSVSQPGYRDYVRRTSAFVPWLPKR